MEKQFKARLDRFDIYNNLPHGSFAEIARKCGCSHVNVKYVLEGYRNDNFGIVKEAEMMAAIYIWQSRFCKHISQIVVEKQKIKIEKTKDNIKNDKLYFINNNELCYSVDAIKYIMKIDGIKEIEAFEAKRLHGSGYFFCHEYNQVGEKNGDCGKNCNGYKPRNGKKGICKNHGFVFERTEKSIIIKI